MYINPFIAGMAVTIFAELVTLFVWALFNSKK